jgi:hypothetical protein
MELKEDDMHIIANPPSTQQVDELDLADIPVDTFFQIRRFQPERNDNRIMQIMIILSIIIFISLFIYYIPNWIEILPTFMLIVGFLISYAF